MTPEREAAIREAAAHFTHGDADSGEHHSMLCEVLTALDDARVQIAQLQTALTEMCWYQTGECDYDCGHPSCQGRQMARRIYAEIPEVP